jgi:hypothetical protein
MMSLPGTLNSPAPGGKQKNCLPGINAVYTRGVAGAMRPGQGGKVVARMLARPAATGREEGVRE